MGGALLLERFWWARSLTCCRVRLRAGMVFVITSWRKTEKMQIIFQDTCATVRHFYRFLSCKDLWCTSGGVSVGGVVSEVLEEVLDGEGLTDSFESLSASLAPLPFTWQHKYTSASLRYIYWQIIKCTDDTVNLLWMGNYYPFFPALVQYENSPQGGCLGFELVISTCTILRGACVVTSTVWPFSNMLV